MSRDNPETLLQMVRETESENRRLGAMVESLRARLLTTEEAQEVLDVINDSSLDSAILDAVYTKIKPIAFPPTILGAPPSDTGDSR